MSVWYTYVIVMINIYIQLNFYTHFIDKTWIYGQDTRRYTMKDTWLIKNSTWMEKKNVYRIDVYNNRYEFNVLDNTYRIQILMRYTFQNILTKTNSSYMNVLGIIEKVSNSWTQYPSRKIIGAHEHNIHQKKSSVHTIITINSEV